MSQEKIQQLTSEVTILKARIFDFSEAVQERDQQLQAHQQILGEICKLVGIDGSRGVEPQAIISAVAALIPVPVEPEAVSGEEVPADDESEVAP